MKTKSKIRNESTLFIIILVGILVFANLISVKFFTRGDLTKNRQFTLSNASLSLMKSLDDKLLVKAYFTKNLPGRYATLEQQVRDVLEEYKQNSNGHMDLEFIDPAGDEEEEKVAQSLGINKMPNPDIEKDQATVKEGYRGISFSYGEKTEAIRAVETPIGLEYEITTTLKKIIGDKRQIGFVTGHGEPSIEGSAPDNPMMQQQQNPGEYQTIRNNLDIYRYVQLDLKERKEGIPEDVNALVLAGTTGELSDKELYYLDQFLLRGGSLAVLMNGVNVEKNPSQHPALPATYNVDTNSTNLRDFLKHFGVAVGQKLVMDAQASNTIARCSPIPLPIPRPNPSWPIVTSFGKDHPVTFGVGMATMPYPSSVRITEEAAKDSSMKSAEIAFSSGNSWSVDAEGAEVDPCNITVSEKLESSIPLGAVVEGTFTSYFKGKDLPKDKSIKKDGFVEKGKKPGKLIVFGSSQLPTDTIISTLAKVDRRQAFNNFTLMQNILDWMTNDEDLIAVRMKNSSDPPISKDLSDVTRSTIKYGNIIGIPLVFMLFGVVRWRMRRVKKNGGAPQTPKPEKAEKADKADKE